MKPINPIKFEVGDKFRYGDKTLTVVRVPPGLLVFEDEYKTKLHARVTCRFDSEEVDLYGTRIIAVERLKPGV